MTEENQSSEENDDKSTLDGERDSEESSEDLENLFDDEESKEDAPVSREEYNRLLKGTKKIATELGRLKSKPAETEEKKPAETNTENSSEHSDDVSELFFSTKPQAEFVKDDLKVVADAKYKGSILKAWNGEKWLQDKAKTLSDEKTEDEANVSSISRPGQGRAGITKSFAHIDLSNKADVEWLNSKPGRRQDYMDWYATHK